MQRGENVYSVKPETIKEADTRASNEYGMSESILMNNACLSVYEAIVPYLSPGKRIAVLCGKGNNAGDGYGVALLLYQNGFDVTCVKALGCDVSSAEAKEKQSEFTLCGGKIVDADSFLQNAEEYGVIIDAIFGVGFCGSIDEKSSLGVLIERSNALDSLKIAIDVPSGINSLDGTVPGISFKADITACVALYKTGLLSYPAKEYSGKVILCDIGFPASLTESLPKHALIPDEDYIKSAIPEREANSHKGTYGRLMLYCASRDMTGAGYLSAMGALRTGVGLANVVSDEYAVGILQQKLNEPVFSSVDVSTDDGLQKLIRLCTKADAILCGCGLEAEKEKANALFEIIKNAEVPLIIDADGINLLCSNINILKEAKQTPVITPHPAEFARLTGKTVSEVQSDRINLALRFSAEYGCVTVLKGASTVIASPDGKLSVNITGNAGLAKGGSGDVLAGVISGLICQGINQFDAAAAGVYLHGKAADILKERIGEYGLLPSDLPLEIAKLLP